MKHRDIFEEKFEEAILSYPAKCEFSFDRAIKKIAKIIEYSISNREYGNFHTETERVLSESLEICKDYEMNNDAVDNIRKYVFEAKHSKIVTLNCPKWENFKELVGNYLLNNLPERGFVYIAWRIKPLEVYYIGKTDVPGGDRILNISKHIHLTRAIEKGAKYITIIFPNKSDDIGNVEASFMRIMSKLGHEILNRKPEHFNTCHQDISELENFFMKMSDMVGKYNK